MIAGRLSRFHQGLMLLRTARRGPLGRCNADARRWIRWAEIL